MKVTKTMPLLISGAFLLFALGCERHEGPAERAGEQIDKSLEKSGSAVDNAMEKTGKAMEEAGDEIKDKAQGH